MSEIHRTARSGAPVTGEDPDLMIRLTNVSKVYRLGEIGSGTLYRDLQSWQAKRKGLPDPNRKIGHESLLSNEPFFALKDIDLAFLPCNQPYTMTVEQCVHAAQMIQPKVLIPYHFGNTDLSGLPAQLPGTDVRLRALQ